MSNDKQSTSRQAALDLLQRGVADLLTSEGWRRALEFRQQFHNYSFFNSSLIFAQKPQAQLVAGFNKWRASGRNVRKGERGIAILAPILIPDPEQNDHKLLVGFKTVYVFDVSQTEGDPIPTRQAPRLLLDTPEDRAKIVGLDLLLTSFCTRRGVSVSWDYQHPSALGAYHLGDKRIAIRRDLGPVQSFKTLCHEAAHMLLHTGAEERAAAELEAETTAFLVCHALGVDTSSYSFAYLAHWSGDLEALLHAGDKASKAANTILDALTRHDEQNHTPPHNAKAA